MSTRQQLELVVDQDLGKFLAADSELNAQVFDTDETVQSQALECGLETVAATVTIVTGAITIADVAVKVTAKIKTWLARRGQESTAIISRGETDDYALKINRDIDPSVIEKVLHKNAFDADESV